MYAPAKKLRNRDREAENVNHKHSLRGREFKNVNALKLHQKAFSIGTKLYKFLRFLQRHGFPMQMHLRSEERRVGKEC